MEPRGCGSAAADLFSSRPASVKNGLERSCKDTCYRCGYLCLRPPRSGEGGHARRDPDAPGVTAQVDARRSLSAPQLTSTHESSLYILLRGEAEHPEREVMNTESAVVINEGKEAGEDEGRKEGSEAQSLLFHIFPHRCKRLARDIHGNDGDVLFHICSKMPHILFQRALEKIQNSPSSRCKA